MKKLFTLCISAFIHCGTPFESSVALSQITEFDSTGGRYSELIVSKNVTPDYDVDDFVRIGTAKDAIRWSAETLYQVNKASKKVNGLRDESTLNYLLALMTRQNLMRRISNDSIERTRFFTKDSTSITRATFKDTINNTANKAGERMDVPVYVVRRLNHNRHNIFGEPGSEEWFSGYVDNSFETLSAFWDSVLVREPSSISKRDAMKRSYPVHFLKKYRVFEMLDVADSTAIRLTAVDTTSKKKRVKLVLSIADSILVDGKSDTRKIKTFSFNTNSELKKK